MSAPNMREAGQQQRYDNDDEGLHPHDVLITKWFPECTTLELLDRYPERSEMIRAAKAAEQDIVNGIHRVPPRVPWPRPPPRPRSDLEAGIEEWRQPRLRMINQLMSRWASTSTSLPGQNLSVTIHNRSHHENARSTSVSACTALTAHHALYIPEILSNIIGFLDPKSMLEVHNVSLLWRATVTTVLGFQFRMAYPCPAITYRDLIPLGLEWMQPDKKEIAEMSQKVFDLLDTESKSPGTYFRVYYPARVSQATNLPEDSKTAYRNLWRIMCHRCRFLLFPVWPGPVPQMSLAPETNRWWDLSQVEFNPYFAHIFNGRLRKHYGRIEIDLQPGPLSRSPFFSQTSLTSLVRPMFLTQPPCKGLGLYITQASSNDNLAGYPKRLTHIRDDNGIRVGQFLDELEQHLSAVVVSWLRDIQERRDSLSEIKWTAFPLSNGHDSRDDWGFDDVEPRLKVMIFFDSVDKIPIEMNMEGAVYQIFSRFGDRSKIWKRDFEVWHANESASKISDSL